MRSCSWFYLIKKWKKIWIPNKSQMIVVKKVNLKKMISFLMNRKGLKILNKKTRFRLRYLGIRSRIFWKNNNRTWIKLANKKVKKSGILIIWLLSTDSWNITCGRKTVILITWTWYQNSVTFTAIRWQSNSSKKWFTKKAKSFVTTSILESSWHQNLTL